jgi:hypothetical protein
MKSLASADFFPGEGKILWGQKHTICTKTPKKILFSSKIFEKHTIFGQPGGQGPLLPSPADAHV